MKKLYSFFICTLFSLSASSIGTVDYTKGLSVWFDTPNNLDGQAIWLRASGSILTKRGKVVHFLSETVVWERTS